MGKGIEDLYQKFLDQDQFIYISSKLILLIAASALTWWITNLILSKLEKRYKALPFFEKNKHFFSLLKKTGHYTIIILAGTILIDFLKIPFLEKIFFAILIILLGTFCNSIIRLILPYFEQKLTLNTESKIDDVILDLINRFASVIIYITAIILALDILGVNIMPFIAGAGVAGIAIGFAAKDTLSNIIAGVLLIMDRPFEKGDRIEVWSAPANSATWGDVLEIGLMATKISTTDNIVIVIPNNEIMKRDIVNYTTITQEIRVRIPIGIAYDADVNKAKELITKVSYEMDWAMKDPATKVVVKSFGDSAVNLEARIWISNPRKRIDTISHMTDRVKEVFNEEGIEIPFPKRDIYIKKSEG